jgi:hypothetical protein
VRLDHLLSKERLAVGGGGQRPAVRVCRVGVLVGGDTGELDLVRSGGVSTAWWCCGAGGWESVAGVWLVMVVGTLLGPEGTTGGSGPCGGRCPGGADALWGLLFRCQAWPGRHTVRVRCRVGGVVRGWVSAVGLWVGCWLRIAQWTRASCFLWLSCQGRTVDALAPGADEGRGRPR